ncbi:Spore germination protein B1 [bioreactor metagenome]|uniref:Spore germination protein B1 n=1 Tax=bioreactor metagenome TaxID=1076179 RepID=A0A644WWR4_9ZZZZ
MLGFIKKKLRFWQLKSSLEKEEAVGEQEALSEFTASLDDNLRAINQILKQSSDIVLRRFTFGQEKKTEAALLFIDGMVDKILVHENVLKPLMIGADFLKEDPAGGCAAYLKSSLLFVGDIKETASAHDGVESVLSGDTLLLLDGSSQALIISLRGWETRNVDEPKTETVVRGPREGFTETLRINTALLRRKIKSPNFVMETLRLGERTNTDVCIVYIDGLTDPKLIEEIRQRLKRIHTDAILESGYIEQFIEDAPFSIFSTVGNNEKPDKTAAKILEGRAAILVDGTPFVLTVPNLFIESFQTTEDYYSRPVFASAIRLLRYLSYLISILAPAMYVALTTFHQELIPTPLLLTMAAAHEGVPFPAVLEAALMVTAFEILREAGVRLPRSVGQAVSIVGALVIGEAAVSAGLIGAPMVIVVAITAVSSFVVTPQLDSGAVLRLIFLLLAGFMGGYGIAMGLFAVIIHLASLRSFGTPYLSSLAPFNAHDMKDTLIRAPLWKMRRRPKDVATRDEVRQSGSLMPAPPPAEPNN